MTAELKAKLAKLRAVAPALNKATDAADRVVKDVEKLLSESLSIGIAAHRQFHTEDAPEFKGANETQTPYRVRSLAYGRVDRKFRIHILDEVHVEREDGRGIFGRVTLESEQTLWTESQRETKLESFEQLPALLEEIAERAESLAARTDKTAATVKDVLSALD